MFLTDHKIRTLQALGDGPLDHAELVDQLKRAPYFVRQDLDDLKRERTVRKVFQTKRVVWELTELGHAELGRLNQLTFDDAA
jgi:DNA-binding HxlR family transcriptional regulator